MAEAQLILNDTALQELNMSQSKRTDVLAAAFLDEHRELMGLIAETQAWCHDVGSDDQTRFQKFANLLQNLREQLVAHFIDEEEDGYLGSALDVAPRFASQAEKLQQQHQQFLDQLDTLVARLKAADQPVNCWDETQSEFDSLIRDLRKHESAENSIMQSAFGDDLGVGD